MRQGETERVILSNNLFFLAKIKPEPGDYTYSGMHDHGQLPKPREGGRFAQIIGFVNAAKKASDAYLTQVIEKKKALAATSLDGATGGENCSKKRKI